MPMVRPSTSSQKMAAGHEEQRCRQARGDQFGHFGLLQVAAAHVALQEVAPR